MKSADGLIFIQLKFGPLPVRIVIEQCEQHENGNVSQAINDHQGGNLARRAEHVFKLFPGHRQAVGKSAHHQREKELQRIDVKQDDKQQDRVQHDHVGCLQAIAPRVNEVVIQDLEEHGKE